MTEEQTEVPPLAKVILEAGLATLYLTALVFIAGWSYADRYFAELGLNISAVEGLDSSSFYAFALWVFRDGWLTALGLAGALASVGFVARHSFGLRLSRYVTLLVSLCAILSLFGAGALGGMRAAEQVPRLLTDDYETFRRIIVHPKSDSAFAEFLSARPAMARKGCLRKIYMDRRHLYAYAGYESTKGPIQRILIIPLSEIGVIETLKNASLCVP